MRRIACSLLVCCVAFGCVEEKSSPFTLDGLPGPQVRASYEAQLTVPGFGEDVRFQVTQGRLPFGLVLEPDGRIHGMPTAVQLTRFTITASAPDRGRSWTSSGALSVIDPAGMRLLVEDLPVADPGQAYNHALTAVGGTPIAWRLVRARTFTAPAGEPNQPPPSEDGVPRLSLDASSGVLSGTAPASEQVLLLLVEVTNGTAVAQEVYGLRVGDAALPGWLLAKSEA